MWLSWHELTAAEQEQAISSYQRIRECEEETPCDRKRAEEDTPFCRFERMANGYIYVDV